MKLKFIFSFIIILNIYFITIETRACITFCIRDSTDLICSYSLDFDTCSGYIIINTKNVLKSSLFYWQEDTFLSWTSKFGSISFNQIGNQLPYCGINETGLLVTSMWLDSSVYPKPDNRGALVELQWIQFQLDNSKTVEEVINSDKYIRLTRYTVAPLHYFICDKNGNTAVIEFLKGEMRIYKGKELPLEVLPNTPYKVILDNYLQSNGEYPENSCNSNEIVRFNKTAKMIKDYNQQHSEDIIQYSLNVLELVKCNNTRWQIVFDIYSGQIHYRTRQNQLKRIINIKDFDYSCKSPQMIVDINDSLLKGASDFINYSTELNKKLINPVYLKVKELSVFTTEQKEKIIQYPETMQCNY